MTSNDNSMPLRGKLRHSTSWFRRRSQRTLALVLVLWFAPFAFAAAATSEFVRHTFDNYTGQQPNFLSLGTDGNLYGTALLGGVNQDGTLFRMTPAGQYRVLYAFSGPDGNGPNSIIQGTDGNFYGTTSVGGANNAGTVFMLTRSGAVTTLHSFTGADGSGPNPIIQGRDGILYGTTSGGGTNGYGTVFKLSTTGAFTTLYQFSGSDGENPVGAVVEGADGAFYGMTNADTLGDAGTVYRITSAGQLTTVCGFSGSFYAPVGALIQATDGNFYGAANGPYGAVFRVTPSGTITVMYTPSANPPNNGSFFQVGLVQGSDGALYGTTTGGGAGNNGVLFRLTLAGEFTTLYAFTGYDGALFWNVVEGTNQQLYVAGAQAGGIGDGVIDQFAMQPAPPTLDLYVAPRVAKLSVTSQTMIYWKTTDATACSSNFSGLPPNEGPQAIPLTSPGSFDYTMTCSGANGSVTKTVSVIVTAN